MSNYKCELFTVDRIKVKGSYHDYVELKLKDSEGNVVIAEERSFRDISPYWQKNDVIQGVVQEGVRKSFFGEKPMKKVMVRKEMVAIANNSIDNSEYWSFFTMLHGSHDVNKVMIYGKVTGVDDVKSSHCASLDYGFYRLISILSNN